MDLYEITNRESSGGNYADLMTSVRNEHGRISRCQRANWMILYILVFVTIVTILILHLAFPNYRKDTNDEGVVDEDIESIKDDLEKLKEQLSELINKSETDDDFATLKEQLNDLINKTETRDQTCSQEWCRFGIKFYYFSNITATWNESRERCKQMYNAKLAEPETELEISYLKLQANKRNFTRNYWLGGTDDINEGIWVWVSDQRNITHFDWLSGEPNEFTGHEDCLEMRGYDAYAKTRHYHGWNDYPCNGPPNFFICEKGV